MMNEGTSPAILDQETAVLQYEHLLPIANFRLNYLAREDVRLSGYAGSAWRGAFGHALKATVCATNVRHCEDCTLYRRCVHSYIFETPTPENSDRMRLYPHVPHPYVLAPAWSDEHRITAGGTTTVEVRLFGKAITHLPYVVHALERAGRNGLGRSRGRLELVDVEQQMLDGKDAGWRSILDDGHLRPAPATAAIRPPPLTGDSLRIRFETPLRLQVDGRPCRPETLEPGHLIMALARRLAMLAYFHADNATDIDFQTMTRRAAHLRWDTADLEWADWSRYSSRQRRSMKIGGILGECTLSTDELLPFWPLLWAGQWIHAGKATVMGLGRYRLLV